jgi:sialic acid synthase SpsE
MTKVICEAGLNHNGNFNKALDMISAAKTAGADIVKFQFYYPDTICLNRNDFSAYKLLDKVKMHPSWINPLADECKRLGLEFLCTAFCRFSVQEINPFVKRFKIASLEASNINFVKMVAEFGKPLIISTGKISDRELDNIFKNVLNDITLLYCVSKYPAAVGDYDLSEMERLHKKYGVPVGLSDHTPGIRLSLQAAEKNACIVEKHFTTTSDCVDKEVSLFPQDFKKMTDWIRRTTWK